MNREIEGSLFPLEDSQSKPPKKKTTGKRNRYHYHGKKERGSNTKLWMNLYPDPKRQTSGGSGADGAGLF